MKKIIVCGSLIISSLPICVSAQNIGIGTTSPTRAKLELHGSVGATAAIFGGETAGVSLQSNWPGIGFNQYFNAANKYISQGYGAVQFLDLNYGSLVFDMFPYGSANSVAATTVRALTITQAGNIGIGGAFPAAANLQFPNNLTSRKIVLWETANNDHQYYGFGINSGTLRYNVDAPGAAHRFYAGTGSGSSNLLLSIWGDKQVLVSNSGGGGFLGINVDNAPFSLTVRQAANTGIALIHAGSGRNFEFRHQYTVPTDYSVMLLRFNGSDIGYWRETGEYVGYSDRRLKDNIEPIPPTLSKIMQLQPKVFEYKNHNSRHEKTLGFIAQEVKAIFPELVFVNETADSTINDVHAMSYQGIGVIAIKAIQEQQLQINLMKKEIDLLRRQVSALTLPKQ